MDGEGNISHGPVAADDDQGLDALLDGHTGDGLGSGSARQTLDRQDAGLGEGVSAEQTGAGVDMLWLKRLSQKAGDLQIARCSRA